jgi:hypothetical protein
LKWGLLAAVVAVSGLAVVWDAHLKQAPHWGYCSTEARWMAAADGPRFWEALTRSELGEAVGQDLAQWTHRAELSVRLATGVRPTPARWRTWLSGRMLASGYGGQWGLCVRPGLLARAADLFNSLFGGGVNESGLRRFGDYYYTWREGFLLVSPWPEYLRQTSGGLETRLAEAPGPQSLYFAWRGARSGHVLIQAAEGLPFSGRIEAKLDTCGSPVPAASVWPGEPILVVSGCDARAVMGYAGEIVTALPSGPVLDLTRRIAMLVGQTWGVGRITMPAPPRAFSAAWLGLDVSQTLPVPELGLLWAGRGEALDRHPLWPLATEAGPLPFAWNGRPGWVAPILSEKLSLCLTERGEWWVASSQEPVMNRVLEGPEPDAGVDADLMVALDWRALSRVLTPLLRQAAALELLPEMNVRDVEHELIPFTQAIGRCGRCRFDARGTGSELTFDGFLADTREAAP